MLGDRVAVVSLNRCEGCKLLRGRPFRPVTVCSAQDCSRSPSGLGSQSTRAPHEVYLAGGRLSPDESPAVVPHSLDGFGWENDGPGAAQLALAFLLCATDRETALAQHEAFKRELVATLPQGDFSLRLATVHEWLAARPGS